MSKKSNREGPRKRELLRKRRKRDGGRKRDRKMKYLKAIEKQ